MSSGGSRSDPSAPWLLTFRSQVKVGGQGGHGRMEGCSPNTQNQCYRRSYQTVSQSEGREGDRKAGRHSHICPPPPPSFLWQLMSCLAIVSPGLFKSNTPLRESGGIAGSRSYPPIAVKPESRGRNASTRRFVLHSRPSALLNTTCGFRIRTSTRRED